MFGPVNVYYNRLGKLRAVPRALSLSHVDMERVGKRSSWPRLQVRLFLHMYVPNRVD